MCNITIAQIQVIWMIIKKLSMDRITYGPLHSSFIKLIDHHCIKLCAIIQSLEAWLFNLQDGNQFLYIVNMHVDLWKLTLNNKVFSWDIDNQNEHQTWMRNIKQLTHIIKMITKANTSGVVPEISCWNF